MNDWENESIPNFVNEFSASTPEISFWTHIQAENGKQYLLLLAAEGSDCYNEYVEPMLAKISEAQPGEY
ncbi:MAG: hypothetical protein ACRCU2_14800 [Planktothrix sp.]